MENPGNKPESILYPAIAAEIQRMFDIDQDMREKALKDPDFWDDEVDKRHTQRMKEIIAEIGWPTVSKVGEVGSHNAWLLVQHADHDVEFQRQCLELMKQEREGEVSKPNIAYLEDRVLLKETGQQLYGTQFEQREGKHIPRPIKDIEMLEKRRKEMELGSLEEGIKLMHDKYGDPSEEE